MNSRLAVKKITPSSRITRPRELWNFRELLRSLVVRNLKVKYQRSVLGFLWTMINPLLLAAILTIVFSFVVRIQIKNYWAFLLSGYFVWNFISQMMQAGTTLLTEHSALHRSVAFPSEILIFSAGISRLVEFAIELSLAMVLLAVFHHGDLPASLLLLPVLVTLQVLIAMGLMMIIALLSVFYHDVAHAVPILLLMLFYLSPVFYSIDMVPEGPRMIMRLNPVAMLLSCYQAVLYDGRFPSPRLLGGATAAAAAIGVVGYALYGRYKSLFAEIV